MSHDDSQVMREAIAQWPTHWHATWCDHQDSEGKEYDPEACACLANQGNILRAHARKLAGLEVEP